MTTFPPVVQSRDSVVQLTKNCTRKQIYTFSFVLFKNTIAITLDMNCMYNSFVSRRKYTLIDYML